MNKLLLSGALLTLAAPAWSQTNGCAIDILSTPPASVMPGVFMSDTVIRVFREQANLVLPATIQTDFHGDGWLSDPPTAPQGLLIPQGTAIASWFLHQETISSTQSLRATITFDKNILGVMVKTSSLNAFDQPSGLGLGAPGTSYPSSLQRDLEFDSLDNIAISGRSLYVELESPTFLDHLRVITEPNSTIADVSCVTSGCPGNSGCPCGNNSSNPLSGCDNSTGLSATLVIGGPNFASMDSMAVVMTGLPHNRNLLLCMSATQTAPTVFGAGQNCLGQGPIYRIQIANTGSTGVLAGGGLIGYVNTMVQPNNLIVPGTTWKFQAFYRDPVGTGTCPSSRANATNSLSIPFR